MHAEARATVEQFSAEPDNASRALPKNNAQPTHSDEHTHVCIGGSTQHIHARDAFWEVRVTASPSCSTPAFSRNVSSPSPTEDDDFSD